MESAANLLVKHYRQVLVYAAYDNYVRIRFRADKLRDPRCYFNKVLSQRRAWEKTGGALITWRNDGKEGAHDAILFVECPKSMERLVAAISPTRSIGVIYDPPSWRQHEQQIQRRFHERPNKFKKAMSRLAVVQEFVGRLPEFNPYHLRRALEASVQSSCAPALCEAAGPLSHTER
jgi:hypothetical protein